MENNKGHKVLVVWSDGGRDIYGPCDSHDEARELAAAIKEVNHSCDIRNITIYEDR